MTTQNTSEKRADRRFQWFAFVVLPLIIVVLTALTTYYFTQYGNRIRHWKYYRATTDGVIKAPEISGKNLKLLLDDKPIQNVSTAAVGVFNTSDQDFEDVLLEIEFKGDGKATPALIQPKVNLPPEAYETSNLPDMGDHSLRLGYRLKLANRSNKAVFYATYIFEGDKSPSVEVRIRKKGLELEEVSLSQLTQSSPPVWAQVIVDDFPVMATVLVVGLAIVKAVEKRVRKHGLAAETSDKPLTPASLTPNTAKDAAAGTD